MRQEIGDRPRLSPANKVEPNDCRFSGFEGNHPCPPGGVAAVPTQAGDDIGERIWNILLVGRFLSLNLRLVAYVDKEGTVKITPYSTIVQ
jgi:hypothetical protein